MVFPEVEFRVERLEIICTNIINIEDEASYDTGGSILTSDPAFEDATNADFTPTGEQQVENQTGDPRWFE